MLDQQPSNPRAPDVWLYKQAVKFSASVIPRHYRCERYDYTRLLQHKHLSNRNLL